MQLPIWVKILVSNLTSPEQIIALGFNFLNDVTAYDCLLLIRQNKMLSRETIRQFKDFNIERLAEYLDVDRAIEKLSEERPDIASVIINHPDGIKWLQSQIDLIKEELMPLEASVRGVPWSLVSR